MPFTFHPPTRTTCEVCESIANKHENPLISTLSGRASNADNFPIHNWYNFVLGYSPQFPDYIIDRENIPEGGLIVDPFMGSGTTNVCAKQHGMRSAGIDANDFFDFTAKTKLNWQVNTTGCTVIKDEMLTKLTDQLSKFNWPEDPKGKTQNVYSKRKSDYSDYARKNRIDALPERYISDAPLTKLLLLKDIIAGYNYPNDAAKNLFALAFTTITLPASNVSYGPGFGVRKPRLDADVYSLFKKKIERMIADLDNIPAKYAKTEAKAFLGDARKMSEYIEQNSVDIMITSPPYPGDHEYTKHSKLELIFMDFATNLDDFRVIKKRMLRGSTTNIYKEDVEGDAVKDIDSIRQVVEQIDARLKADGATSGFEKLYTKLIWEYFGGMYKTFQEAVKVLKPGGKFVLLVSDSHAFKMVHIRTAELLAETAVKAGLVKPHIELWQNKVSTSHKYHLFEEVLTVERPALASAPHAITEADRIPAYAH